MLSSNPDPKMRNEMMMWANIIGFDKFNKDEQKVFKNIYDKIPETEKKTILIGILSTRRNISK